ncbi:MAG: hypothetical protein ACFCGT_01855 [Sandaracinaceae bacterium]
MSRPLIVALSASVLGLSWVGPLAAQDGEGDQVSDLPSDARHDRAQIVAIDRVWNAARRRRDRAAEQAADARLRKWLTDELREAQQTAQGAQAEATEQREEAMESGRGRDRRAARDDARDARGEAIDLARFHSVAQQLQALQPAFNRGNATVAQYRRKRQLLDQLVRLARGDVRDERQESREDGREERQELRRRR